MLSRSLYENAAGCFYGSEQLSNKIWFFLKNNLTLYKGKNLTELQENCYFILCETIDNQYPRRYRLNDINQLMHKLCDNDLFLLPNLPWLDDIFERLMRRNGDLICYRETKVQSYVRIAAELDPNMLVAWHISKWIENDDSLTELNIRKIVGSQNAFFAPQGNPILPFAEGHAHYGGITSDSAILDYYIFDALDNSIFNKINYEFSENSSEDKNNEMVNRLKTIFHILVNNTSPFDSLFSSEKFKPWENEWECHLNKLDSFYTYIKAPDWQLMIYNNSQEKIGHPAWIKGQLAHEILTKSANRWLWLQLFMCRCYRFPSTPPIVRVMILCWFQTLNNLRKKLIMDGQGLSRFVKDVSNGPFKRGKPINNNVIKNIFPFDGDLAEIKSKPKAFGASLAKKIANELSTKNFKLCPNPPYIFGEHDIKPSYQTQKYIAMLESWHFCGHFSRTAIEKKPGTLLKPDMTVKWKEARDLLKKIHKKSGWNIPEFMSGNANNNFLFTPSHWFRGLDVAGDENDFRIEWFAPMIRFLRRGFIHDSLYKGATTGFHLSIHAGEDYAHPVSGMRHIDETVVFCDMQDGDRLGHALALGLDPAWWMSRHGEMILPLDEHLDNLVWLWHYSVTLSALLPLASQVRSLLERRIKRFFPLTNWNMVPSQTTPNTLLPQENQDIPEPEVLYQAWLLRRNCYYHYENYHSRPTLKSEKQYILPDFLNLNNKSQASEIYLNRHKHINNKSEQPLVIVRTGDEWKTQILPIPNSAEEKYGSLILEDFDSPAEQEFMLALQDYLIDHYDKMGLIIETNPTSNVYIARLENHAEHPIFRWNPPDDSALLPGNKYNIYGLRRGAISVLINTDDPGIMPTTLRTEYLLLRDAAIEKGFSREVTERWLEKIRQYGIEQFHRNHLPIFNEI